MPPGMRDGVARVRAAGVKTCVISNFDDRLRPLLARLELDSLFDAVVVSAEVGAEKPSPRIFEAACKATGALLLTVRLVCSSKMVQKRSC